MKPKILVIIGARPQFIKHFPLELAAKGNIELVTIHTGQHYDENMSDVFFNQLGMLKPNYQLKIGSGTHAKQTASMMIEIEKICFEDNPNAIVVYGDTNSTLAGALVSSKLHIPLFHIEAGLRSFNKKMPEEVNRVMTDHVSDLLFVPSESSIKNLKNEGIQDEVHEVGDIMKDLVTYVSENKLQKNPTITEAYYYVTLHRPYNVDIKERLIELLSSLNKLDKRCIFSIHPRTKNRMVEYGLEESKFSNIIFISPQGYLENMGYLANCSALVTDSGGMQKEAYWLRKKCVTLRSETEWIETIENNANTLLFEDLSLIAEILTNKNIIWDDNLYGDGQSAQKMVKIMKNYLEQNK